MKVHQKYPLCNTYKTEYMYYKCYVFFISITQYNIYSYILIHIQ